MEFSRQELEWVAIPYWGVEPMFPALADGFFATEPPVKPREYLRLDIWIFALVTVMMDKNQYIFVKIHRIEQKDKKWSLI